MEYGRNIVVKGVGKASSRPDLIVISFDLDSFSKSYDKAMSLAFDKYIFRKYWHLIEKRLRLSASMSEQSTSM